MTDISLEAGTYTAVVDSVEDGFVTVFFERDGEDVGDAVLDTSELPEEGRHADAIFTVTVVDGEPVEWRYEADETAQRKGRAQDRFDQLSRRPGSDDEN
jgi:hypothetical protein